MVKLIMLKGLPASGKSTWAKEQVCAGHGRVKRVNKDDLRAMIDNSAHSKDRENQILHIRDYLVEMWLENGFDVIVDDTNFAPSHETRLKELAANHKAKFEVKFFNVSLSECLKRNRERGGIVPDRAIRDMYNKYLRKAPTYKEFNRDKEACIICDIDGTLAHMSGRSPYDWKRVGEDSADEPIINLLHMIKDKVHIILLSGRDGSCRKETIKWLEDYEIPFDDLHMRQAGDNRKDHLVKRDLYDYHIEPYFEVQFVLDDRDQVVDMWRSLGLKCLQVERGDF